MAFTVRWVRDDAGGSGDGSANNSSDAWTLDQALQNAVAGDHVKVVADGTYTVATTRTTANGTYSTPIWWEGVDSSGNAITPARDTQFGGTFANGELTVSSMPLLQGNGNIQLNFGTNNVLDRLNILMNASTGLDLDDNGAIVHCKYVNQYTVGALSMFDFTGSELRIHNCDFDQLSTSQNVTASAAVALVMVNCRVRMRTASSTGTAIAISANALVKGCVFLGNGTTGHIAIDYEGAAYCRQHLLDHNTFYYWDTCYQNQDDPQDGPVVVMNNVVWDCNTFCNNPYTTADWIIHTAANVVDSSCTSYSGYNQIDMGADLSITADPFVSTTYRDFNLEDSETAIGAAHCSHADCGALQRSHA